MYSDNPITPTPEYDIMYWYDMKVKIRTSTSALGVDGWWMTSLIESWCDKEKEQIPSAGHRYTRNAVPGTMYSVPAYKTRHFIIPLADHDHIEDHVAFIISSFPFLYIDGSWSIMFLWRTSRLFTFAGDCCRSAIVLSHSCNTHGVVVAIHNRVTRSTIATNLYLWTRELTNHSCETRRWKTRLCLGIAFRCHSWWLDVFPGWCDLSFHNGHSSASGL